MQDDNQSPQSSAPDEGMQRLVISPTIAPAPAVLAQPEMPTQVIAEPAQEQPATMPVAASTSPIAESAPQLQPQPVPSLPQEQPPVTASPTDSTFVASQPEPSVAGTTQLTQPPAPALQQPQPMASAMPQPSKRRISKPLAIAGIAVLAALAIGGGYVFGFYLPNRPENVFSASLSNTALGIDHLLDYSKQQNSVNYKSMAFDGNLTVKSPTASFDATLTGSADQKGDASSAMAADVMGQKLTVNVRTIPVHGDESPDVYFQVNGIKQLLSSNGLADELDSVGVLDGQWVSVDHTLIDTYAASLKASGDAAATTQQALSIPTYAQLDDAARKVQVVNKQYLFTTDSSRAVLTQQKFIGQEVAGGRTLDHYTVSYDKAHFAAYVDALKTAVDQSSLNDWSKKANNGKSLSTVLSLDDLKSGINASKGGYAFDLWADTSTKLVSKVAFKDSSDPTGTFTISQGYNGGSSYPFTLTVHTKDDSGNPEDAILDTGIDTASHKVTASLALTSKASDGTTQVNLTLHGTPSNDPVTVSVPAGAKPIDEVLNALGLGGLTDGTLPLGGSDTSALAPLVLQQ